MNELKCPELDSIYLFIMVMDFTGSICKSVGILGQEATYSRIFFRTSVLSAALVAHVNGVSIQLC